MEASAMDVIQAALTANDTGMSHLWRAEDRQWRTEDRKWREEDLVYRSEERQKLKEEAIMRTLEIG